MKQKYTVTIAGTELTVISENSEEYVKELAKKLDKEIEATIVGNNKCTKLEAAIVCALDHYDKQLKLENKQ